MSEAAYRAAQGRLAVLRLERDAAYAKLRAASHDAGATDEEIRRLNDALVDADAAYQQAMREEMR